MLAADHLSRRSVLAAPAALAMAGDSSAGTAADVPTARMGNKPLVAFVSRSGNTRVIAGTLQRDLGADLFEIEAAQPYPADYEATVERARQERDRGATPALAATLPTIGRYDTVFLGFPIWGETTPPIVRTFLKAHDLRGRTIRPFITHGGYGVGSSLDVLASHAPGARIEPALVMEADQERCTMNLVRGWIGDTALPPTGR